MLSPICVAGVFTVELSCSNLDQVRLFTYGETFELPSHHWGRIAY